jgi:hypothetical protein
MLSNIHQSPQCKIYWTIAPKLRTVYPHQLTQEEYLRQDRQGLFQISYARMLEAGDSGLTSVLQYMDCCVAPGCVPNISAPVSAASGNVRLLEAVWP